jgi:hypothetical protein
VPPLFDLPYPHSECAIPQEFARRAESFVAVLREASFGEQLLFIIGTYYVVHAQRHLRRISAVQRWRYIVSSTINSMSSTVRSVKPHIHFDRSRVTSRDGAYDPKKDAVQTMFSLFQTEFDAVSIDLYYRLKIVAVALLEDDSATEDVRRKRAYALWWLGELMRDRGKQFADAPTEREELQAYIAQSVTSAKSKGAPPPF